MSKIFVSKQRELYNPRCHIPQQPFWLIHTPKLGCNRPQVPVLVSDCFLLYPFHLETNRWEQVPLSNPMGAPLPMSLLPASLHHNLQAGLAFLFCYHSYAYP